MRAPSIILAAASLLALAGPAAGEDAFERDELLRIVEDAGAEKVGIRTSAHCPERPFPQPRNGMLVDKKAGPDAESPAALKKMTREFPVLNLR